MPLLVLLLLALPFLWRSASLSPAFWDFDRLGWRESNRIASALLHVFAVSVEAPRCNEALAFEVLGGEEGGKGKGKKKF